MFDYLALRRAAFAQTLDGHSLSMPVPVVGADGCVRDRYFVYSVDGVSSKVAAPWRCFELDLETGGCEELDAEALFSGVEFSPTDWERPDDFIDLLDEAEELYGDVRDEVLAGGPGPAARRYGEVLGSMSYPFLMPYYEVMAPGLFSADAEPEA